MLACWSRAGRGTGGMLVFDVLLSTNPIPHISSRERLPLPHETESHLSWESVWEELSQPRGKGPATLQPLWDETSLGPLVPLSPGGIPRGPHL